MKTSDGFDARRLRRREPSRWRLRFGAFLAAAALLFGLLGILLGSLSLTSAVPLGGLGDDGAVALLVVGVILAWLGLVGWRRCRRRLRRDSALSMSPHLMRRRG